MSNIDSTNNYYDDPFRLAIHILRNWDKNKIMRFASYLLAESTVTKRLKNRTNYIPTEGEVWDGVNE